MCVEREGAMESIPALAEVQMRVEPAFSDDEDEWWKERQVARDTAARFFGTEEEIGWGLYGRWVYGCCTEEFYDIIGQTAETCDSVLAAAARSAHRSPVIAGIARTNMRCNKTPLLASDAVPFAFRLLPS
jgi:hypothetical protein